MDTMLTPAQLAERWSMSTGTLENWRCQKKGPPWIKVGTGSRGTIRYRLKDVIAYEKRQTKGKS